MKDLPLKITVIAIRLLLIGLFVKLAYIAFRDMELNIIYIVIGIGVAISYLIVPQIVTKIK
jgi:hypothetical protein